MVVSSNYNHDHEYSLYYKRYVYNIILYSVCICRHIINSCISSATAEVWRQLYKAILTTLNINSVKTHVKPYCYYKSASQRIGQYTHIIDTWENE